MEEVWKDIAGYEGFYQVSNTGKVKSLVGWDGHKYVNREIMINPYKQKTNKSEYLRSVVKLKKHGEHKDFKVHRLVAQAFINNKNNYNVVNHKDGNPLNNSIDNLEWCTQKHNCKHAIENGLNVRRIDTIDRETMVEFLNSGKTYDEIAITLGIAKGTVFNYIKKFNIKKIYI